MKYKQIENGKEGFSGKTSTKIFLFAYKKAEHFGAIFLACICEKNLFFYLDTFYLSYIHFDNLNSRY